MAAEHERRLHNRIGVPESRASGIAGDEHALEGEIVAELGMDHRRAGIERGLGIGDRGQLLVADLDQLAGVLGLRARARHHGADRLALPAGPLDRERVLRRRLDAFEMGEHADPGRDHLGELGAGDDGDDARRLLRRRRVDLRDAGMACGERTKATCAMRGSTRSLTNWARPWVRRARFGPRHRAADIGVRAVECGERRTASRRRFSRPTDAPLAALQNRVGHIIVRHICGGGTAV